MPAPTTTAPDASLIPAPRIASVPHMERRCNGLDLSDNTAEALPGLFTRLDNVRLSYGKSVTRPGFQGRLATKHGASLYGITEYRNADGTTTLLYDTGGRIYKLPQSATADTEIIVPGSGSLASAGTQYSIQQGAFKYRVDGVAPLLRIDPNGGTAKLALNAPTAPLAASLTSSLLDDWGTSTFAVDTLSGSGATNRVLNGDFSVTSGTDSFGRIAHADHWTEGGTGDYNNTVPTYGTHAALPNTWAIADTPGDSFLADAFANDAQSLDSARKATSVYIQFDYYNPPDGSDGGTPYSNKNASILVSAIAFASAGGTGAEIRRVTREYVLPQNGAQSATLSGVFEFGDLASPIGSIKLLFLAGSQNQNASTGPVFRNVIAYPYVAPVTATESAGMLTLTQGAVQYISPGQLGTLFFNGLHVRRTYGTAKDLRGSFNVDIPLGAGYPAELLFRLRLHASGSVSGVAAAWYNTNAATIDTDTLNATVDISTVPLGVLQSVDMIELVFLSDAPITGAPSVSLGPLRSAGDLSVAPAGGAAYAPVTYSFTELDDTAGTAYLDPLESNPSPPSASLTPTGTQAQAQGTLPAPVNATTTAYGLYRTGGVRTVTQLVGYLPVGSDTPLMADDGFLTWNHTTRTFTDNTPDSWLEVTAAALLDYGRDAPVAGATAVCIHQGRLWIAKGGRVYASWLFTADTQNTAYFNQTLDPTDPNREIKGDTFIVGGDDKDPVTAMISLGQNAYFEKGYLVVFKRSSAYIIGGTGPGQWYQEAFLTKQGIGCVGPNACGQMGGRIWFLSDGGVNSFAADTPDPKSAVIEKGLFTPSAVGGCDPAAWAKSAAVVHDRRFHVCVPTPGDGAPTVKFVYDSRQDLPGGWTSDRAVNGSFAPAFTGGCTVSGGTAAGALYWAGQDGQVYQEAGALDKALSSSTGVGIAYAVESRGVGQEGDGLDYSREKRCSWWRGRVQTAQAGGSVTCGIIGENGQTWTEPHYLNPAGGTTKITKDVPSYVRGEWVKFTLSGVATQPHTLLNIGGETSAGGLR